MKSIKKITLSLIAFGALSVSANAACSAEYCSAWEAGIGGAYANTNGSEANVNNYGGYFKFYGDTLYKQRLYFGADIKIGGGQSSLSGANLTSLSAKTPFLSVDGTIKLGLNVLTANTPLIASIFFNYDNVYTKNGVDKSLPSVGAELSGRIPVGKLNILYSGGYGWVFSPFYTYNLSNKAWIGGYNDVISASFGLSYNFSEKAEVYIRVVGKYYRLNAAKEINNINFPNSNQYTAMLEIGFRGVSGYSKSF